MKRTEKPEGKFWSANTGRVLFCVRWKGTKRYGLLPMRLAMPSLTHRELMDYLKRHHMKSIGMYAPNLREQRGQHSGVSASHRTESRELCKMVRAGKPRRKR